MAGSRNYPLLLAAQTLGAFGDQFVLAVILGQFTFMKVRGEIPEADYQLANAVYPMLLFIPYVLGAPLTGYLNDRFSKTRWLLGGNIIKLVGTLIAMASLSSGPGAMAWQGVGYFIVGIGACIYGPAKYGILPEILPLERLVKANGTVEMLTLLAILLGGLGGAKMIDHYPPVACYGVLLVLFGTAAVLNACMTVTPSNPDVRWQNSVGAFFGHFRGLFAQQRLGRVLLGTAVFWICGAVFKMNFNPWGAETLNYKDSPTVNTDIALLGLWLAVGVMIGSMLAGQLHRVGELRWTQRYGWMLAAVIASLGLINHLGLDAHTQRKLAVAGLIGVGLFAGLFLIPLNAALQAEGDPWKLGKTIACQNFQENVAMTLSGGLVAFATSRGASAPEVFLGLAALVFVTVTLLKIPEKQPPSCPPRRRRNDGP